jgi:hypothetical protein
MTVPKAPMNQKNQTVPRENHVWLTWQIAPMQPESVTHLVQGPANRQFRGGISGADPRHIGATLRID